MVWIHGGSFEVGSGDMPGVAGMDMYDGCHLARQGVIVVTVNYRLGPLGFMAFKQHGGDVAANFGIQDQREALEWVRREAVAFGGDPGKVTLFGESAGAISVLHHMASPLSRGLFRAGISESGFPFASCIEKGLERTAAMAAKLGCGNSSAGDNTLLGCLRRHTAQEIISAAQEDPGNPLSTPSLSWWPVIDGVDMPEHPLKLFSEGRANQYPLLAGTNTNESNLFVWLAFEGGMNETQYRQYFEEYNQHLDPAQQISPPAMDLALRTYPPSPQGDNKLAAAQLVTDSAFLAGTRAVADKHSVHADTFVYRFNHRSGCLSEATKWMPGVFHSIELPYVFRDPAATACWFDSAEAALSERMQEMWANFAKQLSPASESVDFPRYSAASRRSLVLQTPSDVIEENYREAFCELWYNISWSKLIATSGGPDVSIVV